MPQIAASLSPEEYTLVLEHYTQHVNRFHRTLRGDLRPLVVGRNATALEKHASFGAFLRFCVLHAAPVVKTMPVAKLTVLGNGGVRTQGSGELAVLSDHIIKLIDSPPVAPPKSKKKVAKRGRR